MLIYLLKFRQIRLFIDFYRFRMVFFEFLWNFHWEMPRNKENYYLSLFDYRCTQYDTLL